MSPQTSHVSLKRAADAAVYRSRRDGRFPTVTRRARKCTRSSPRIPARQIDWVLKRGEGPVTVPTDNIRLMTRIRGKGPTTLNGHGQVQEAAPNARATDGT